VREHEVYAIGYPGDKTSHPIPARKAAARRSGRLGKITAPLLSLGSLIADKLRVLTGDVVALYMHIEPKRRPLFLALVGAPLVLLLAFSLKTLSRIERAAKPAPVAVQPLYVAMPVSGVAATSPVVSGTAPAQPGKKKVTPAAKQDKRDAAKIKAQKKEARKKRADVPADPVLSKVFGFSTGGDQKLNAKISLRCASGALLFVDGGQKGRVATSELTVNVLPGKHVVIVIDSTQKMFSKTIKSEAGKTVEIKPPFCK
jgi:hypothetical protein